MRRQPEVLQPCGHVFLCAGAIETPRLLLLNGLANSSGQVGRNFMAHTGIQVWGRFADDVHPHKGIPGGLISEATHRPQDGTRPRPAIQRAVKPRRGSQKPMVAPRHAQARHWMMVTRDFHPGKREAGLSAGLFDRERRRGVPARCITVDEQGTSDFVQSLKGLWLPSALRSASGSSS